MAKAVKGVVGPEIDTNALFEKYDIEEIRDIEKKTRSDIEKKKEELRMMVGERYRDLIEAADTITEMKNSSENVMQSIGRMQELCQKMKQNHMIKGFNIVSKPKLDLNTRREETQFYAIASQIKLLLDMPEKIWSALDSRSYLRATQMYLLSRHVHTSMQVGAGAETTRLLSYFPVLARTWAAISHFRDVILQACKEMLKCSSISDEDAAECLCSLLLLEDSTPRQVFNDYLVISTLAVQQLFSGDQSYMSVKDQVCAVVEMIVRTIHQIYTVFYTSPDNQNTQMKNNLLVNIVAEITDKGEAGRILKDGDSPALKHLPATVRGFRPSLRSHASPIQEKNLQENSQQWVKTCIQTVSSGLSQLLTYISSVKGLSSIRRQVWELLNNDSRMKTWDIVCSHTLQRQLAIWDEFFQPHFLTRTNALLQVQYENALSSCKQQVTRVLADLSSGERSVTVERDVSSYVWVEGPMDMPANMAWVTIGNKTLADAGTLAMKARAYTPAIQNLCRSFDGRLKTLLEDAGHYLKPEIPGGGGPGGGGPGIGPGGPAGGGELGAFDQYADTPVVLTFMQDSCGNCINKLLEFLDNQLYACKKQVESNTDHSTNVLVLDRVLLLGRLSGALSELSVHLHQCMIASTEKVELTRVSKKHLGSKVHSKTREHPRWREVKDKLAKFHQESFNFWGEYTSNHLSNKFRDALLDSSGSTILRAYNRWDEIQIQEETEEGETMKSTIRVPMRPSWYLSDVLYDLCEQVNRVGGHAIHRNILQSLVWSLSDSFISAYEEVSVKKRPPPAGPHSVTNMPLTQSRCLQLMFDVKILSHIIPRKDDTQENKTYQKRVQAVIDQLESHVDPFDLDVFSPYINNHLSRQTQRFSVLFGSLMSLDKHGVYISPRPSHTSHQEQHNILPLCVSQNRLPLLPLSIQSRPPTIAPTIIQPSKSKSQPILAPSSPAPEIPIPRNETTGFLANMSTLWFSNVSKK